MSSPFDVYAASVVTVYGTGGGTDDYGRPISSMKGLVTCELETGGAMQRDSNGDEFVPASTIKPVSTNTVVFEYGDKIAFGDTTASSTPPSDAELVRKVREIDEDFFGWGKALIVYTG